MKFLWRKTSEGLGVEHVHPCLIDGKACFVYSAKLRRKNPTAYKRLVELARQSKRLLICDRRKKVKSGDIKYERRARWIPVIALTVNTTLAGASVNAEQMTQKNELNSSQIIARVETSHFEELSGAKSHSILASPDIEAILFDHVNRRDITLSTRRKMLHEVAMYYNQFPQVRALFTELKGKAWTLTFSDQQYKTDVFSSGGKVSRVKIYFNPNLSAQLQFDESCDGKRANCMASPADLLLHELLHAYTILKKPEAFMSQISTRGKTYPLEHEHKTITLEQAFFRAMSEVDGRARPRREKHFGQSFGASCPTCID